MPSDHNGYRKPPQYRVQYAQFLRALPMRDGCDWTHWVTLTFRNDVAQRRAQTAFYRWLRRCAKLAGVHVLYAHVDAPQPDSRRFHAHVLLRFPEAASVPTSKTLDTQWSLSDTSANFARIARYDPTRRGVEYLVNHDGEIECGVACPRDNECRRTRCLVMPVSGWGT